MRNSRRCNNFMCVAIGGILLTSVLDVCSDKTNVLSSFSKAEINMEGFQIIPKEQKNSFFVSSQQNNMCTFSILDTSGQEELDHLRAFNYVGCQLVLLFFSLVDPSSLKNAKRKWYSEIKENDDTRICPILLVGTKLDLRRRARINFSKNIIRRFEGEEAAGEIHASAYFECSSKTGQGISDLFESAIRSVFSPQKKEAMMGFQTVQKLILDPIFKMTINSKNNHHHPTTTNKKETEEMKQLKIELKHTKRRMKEFKELAKAQIRILEDEVKEKQRILEDQQMKYQQEKGKTKNIVEKIIQKLQQVTKEKEEQERIIQEMMMKKKKKKDDDADGLILLCSFLKECRLATRYFPNFEKEGILYEDLEFFLPNDVVVDAANGDDKTTLLKMLIPHEIHRRGMMKFSVGILIQFCWTWKFSVGTYSIGGGKGTLLFFPSKVVC